MALPSSGQISLNQMHVEVGGASGTQASLNDADIRGLISKSSGVQMAFNEWYGASSFDNLAVISIGTYQHLQNPGAKFPSYTYYNGWNASSGGLTVGGANWGSSSNYDYALNGNSFDMTALTWENSGTVASLVMVFSGNYNGLTAEQVTGYRYLKSGSSVFVDSNYNGVANNTPATGVYNSTNNFTKWNYFALSGSGYITGSPFPGSGTGTYNFVWSN